MSEFLRWPARERPHKANRVASLLVMAGLGVLYWMTASRSIQGGDSGEFMTIALEGGVAHPPGYPLYVMLARLFGELPLVNPALSVSLLSGVCGVATVAVLYAALTRWGLGDQSALVAICVFAISPLFWRYTGVPEVFTLNTLMAASIVWCAGRRRSPQGISRALLVGLALGLGLSNHHTIVLLAPVVGAALLRAGSERGQRRWLVLPVFALGLVVGLTPYLSLLGPAPEAGWAWGDAFDFGALVDHVLRRDYGTLSLGVVDQAPAIGAQHAAYALHVLRAFTIFTPLAVLGVVAAALSARTIPRRRAGRHAEVDAAALLASLVLCMVFFALMNLRPEGLAAHVVARFYLLPDLLLTVFLAAGIEMVLRARAAVRPFVRPFTAGAASILCVMNVGEATWADDYAVEDYVLNALESVPPRSVIVGTGELVFAFLAAQEAYAHRSDVVYIDLHLLRYRWYHERVSEALPALDVPYDPERTPVRAILTALLERHPVYITEIAELDPRFFEGEPFYVYPVGPLLAVVRPGGGFPRPDQVLRLNRQLLAEMRFRGRPEHAGDSWSGLVQSYYRRTWLRVASALEAFGDPVSAAEARDTASRFESR